MPKVINKKYIKDFVKSNLQYLTKDSLISIAQKYDVKIKTSDYKDNIAKIITETKGVDYWEIYTTYKKYEFGLYPTQLEELLNIDKKQRKKIENDLVKIAYYKESKADWGKVNVPFYDLESLYKLDISKLEEWKEKHKSKKATPKQIEALEKAREKAKLSLTCGICGHETSKKYIYNRICDNCRGYYSEVELINSYIEDRNNIKEQPNKYVIAHFETSGLSYDDEIVSCSVIDLDGNILMDELLKIHCKISSGATSAHGITNEMVQEKGISSKEFLKRFYELTKNKTIIAWNYDFLCKKIMNFINGGYLEQYPYGSWDDKYNESEYNEHRKREKERYIRYKTFFGNKHNLYINYAYENHEWDRFREDDIWTSVHRCGYSPINRDDLSITTKGCLSMLNYINSEKKLLELPQFWIDNN